MPDLDFIGFSEQYTTKLIKKMKPTLESLPFHEDIVFIRNGYDSSVIKLDNSEAPFLRIYTRSPERAKILTESLKEFCDIEIIYIAMFTEKTEK